MKRAWIGWGLAGGLVVPAVAEVERVYLDADDGGRHGVISASLESAEGRERLVVRIRAEGLGVEGEGGWQSRVGFNAHTAREMESVLRVDGFEARVRGLDGTLRPAEVAWEKRLTTFPRRRLLPDWSIDYFARTAPLVGELTLQTTAGLAGTNRLELLARGEPRLLLEYSLAEGRVTGMGMPGHSRSVPVALLVAELKAPAALELPKGWRVLGMDGKWRFFDREVGEEVATQEGFVKALELAKDWLFLEQVALYANGAFGTHGIGVILHEAKAPNWRRVSGWFGAVSRGHSGTHANSLLADPNERAQSLGWMNKHHKRLDPSLLALKARWDKEGLVPVAPVGDLPPWTEDEVLGGIGRALQDRENPLAQDERMTAIRGIQGWAVSQRWGSPWAEKVVDLIEDRDWRIAEAACLAFSHGTTSAVPSAKLWKVAHDLKKDQRLREAAYLAWTYGSWDQVFVELHERAMKPGDALWMPAVSRLGELGNGWTIELLTEVGEAQAGAGGLKDALLRGPRRRLLTQELGILKKRFAKGNLSHNFETTCWAVALGFSRSGDMEEWMLNSYGNPTWDTDASRKLLLRPRGWGGGALPPAMLKDRLEVRKRLLEELEFRWKKSRPAGEGEGVPE